MNKLSLKTKRLKLRIFKIADVTPGYVKALNSEEIIKFTESRYQKWTMSKVKKYVKEKANKKGESILIGLFLKKEGRHIGNIRLHSFSKHNKRVEVGALIWDRSEWGKGYATEALESVYNYLFNIVGLHKICAEIYSVNKAPAKIAKKLGFNIEGVFKDHFYINGEYVDAVRIAKINPGD